MAQGRAKEELKASGGWPRGRTEEDLEALAGWPGDKPEEELHALGGRPGGKLRGSLRPQVDDTVTGQAGKTPQWATRQQTGNRINRDGNSCGDILKVIGCLFVLFRCSFSHQFKTPPW